MLLISEFTKIQNIHDLISKLCTSNIEIGMIEFNNKDEINPLPDYFLKVGNFELDILAINSRNSNIVLLDHDKSDFVMQLVATNIYTFIDALLEIQLFYKECKINNKLYDDFEKMEIVAKNASDKAGGEVYSDFYKCIFGI